MRSSRSSPAPARASAARAATASGTVAGNDALSTGTFAASPDHELGRGDDEDVRSRNALVCAGHRDADANRCDDDEHLSSPLTGKTCAWTKTDGTTLRAFFGKGAVTGAGTLAALTG